MSLVGATAIRKDDPTLLTGQGPFIDDLAPVDGGGRAADVTEAVADRPVTASSREHLGWVVGERAPSGAAR